MSLFIVAVTFINIILWIVFFIRFKKIFSTDKIIDETRMQMNQLIKDIDSATDRNMYLVREGKNTIDKVLKDADDYMQKFSEASMRLKNMIAETEKQNQKINKPTSVLDEYNKPKLTRKTLTNPQIETYLKNSQSIKKTDPESSYEVVSNSQPDLFTASNVTSVLKDETIITKEGAAYKEVPLIITDVYDEKLEDKNFDDEKIIVQNSIQQNYKENSLQQKVKQLYEQDYTSEQIAQQLSCSITEVDFIIDML